MNDAVRQETMQTVLTVLLLAGGYFCILRVLIANAASRSAAPAIAIVLLLIYGGIGGFLVITFRGMGAMSTLLLSILLFLCIGICVLLVRYFHTNYQDINKGALVLFLLYVLAVFYITLFVRKNVENLNTDILLQPFASLSEAVEQRSFEPLQHMALNAAMFVPVGFLFCMIDPEGLSRFLYVVPTGMLLSVMIEAVQMIFSMGQTDIDDVIANTLGTAAGAVLYRIFHRFRD